MFYSKELDMCQVNTVLSFANRIFLHFHVAQTVKVSLRLFLVVERERAKQEVHRRDRGKQRIEKRDRGIRNYREVHITLVCQQYAFTLQYKGIYKQP